MTIGELIAIILGSAGLTTFFIFLLRRFVDFGFRKIERKDEAQIALKMPTGQEFFKKQMAIYPELIELIYRLRNLARECCRDHKRNNPAIQEFYQGNRFLIENLYKYKPFLPEDIFRQVHFYKTQIQEYAVLLDELTRPTEVEDAPVDMSIRNIAEQQLERKFKIIDKMYNSLTPIIKEICKEKLKF